MPPAFLPLTWPAPPPARLACFLQRFTLTLGYWLARPHWGHGIMSKVLPAFLAFIWKAHPEIQRIEAHVYDYNDRSQSVLEKVGFQVVSVPSHMCLPYGDVGGWTTLACAWGGGTPGDGGGVGSLG